jgi:hypothetical protein
LLKVLAPITEEDHVEILEAVHVLEVQQKCTKLVAASVETTV